MARSRRARARDVGNAPAQSGRIVSTGPTADRAACVADLERLWPAGLPAGAMLAVAFRVGSAWSARQHASIESAADDLVAAPNRHLTMALMRPLERGRGGAKDAVALPGLWLDLDDSRGDHSAPNLPTQAEALEFLRALPVPPSRVHDSGGGSYAFWDFDVAWLLPTREERARAAHLSKAWQQLIRERGAERGWHVDETSDLARCLRAAGTINAKYTPPRLVRAVDFTNGAQPLRFNVAEFEAFARRASRPVRRSSIRSLTTMTSTASASPAMDWLALVASAFGGEAKRLDDESGGGIVLRVCPYCEGREAGGTVAPATAHVNRRSAALRCKRASCEAYEGRGGLPIETWSARIPPALNAEVRQLRAVDIVAAHSLTDDGNAMRFLGAHGRDVCFVPGVGWHVWDCRRFEPVPTGKSEHADRVVDLARDAMRKIAHEADGAEESQRSRIVKHSMQSRAEPAIRRACALLRCDVSIPAADFDRVPSLLNVTNGTLDLRTGELRRHARTDRLTLLAGTDFERDARCDALDDYFGTVTGGDVSLLEYLDRLLGSTLWGECIEDRFVLMLGPGGSGKSTFLESMFAMLGEYAGKISFDALVTAERGASPRPEIVALRGKRFVAASEVREHAQLDAALLKSLTGGDTLIARTLYHGPVTFRLGATFWLAANHPPRLDAGDSGLRRRLAVLPFARAIAKPDTALRLRLQEPDARRALLARALRGCLDWRARGGFGTCDAVEAATREYWDGDFGDALRAFVDACCERDRNAWTPSARIHEAACRAAVVARARAPSLGALASVLRERGFENAPRGKARGWRLRLKAAAREVTQ